MPDETMWKEMLDTLKDVASYLEKQDELEKQITQEKATIDKPPKAQVTQDPIVGKGPQPAGAPETDKVITKAVEDKKDEEAPKEDEEESEESEESESSDEELKSILKDIRSALSAQTELVKSEIKKALPQAVNSAVEKQLDKTLRKMGYHPTHPDVVKIGIDTTSEVKKSEDSETEVDIKKSDEDSEKELLTAIDKLARNASWQQLGQMREKAGLFRPF